MARRFATFGLFVAAFACGCPQDLGGASTGDVSEPSTTSSSGVVTTEGSSTTSDTTTSAADTAASSSESDALPDPDCDCLPERAQPGGDMLATPMCMPTSCSVSAACEVFRGSMCVRGTFVLEDEAALDCALSALRDRSAGVIVWTLELSSGYGNSNGYVVVLPDGQVITRRADRIDRVVGLGDALLGAPPPASSFAECLALTDPQARFECLSFDAGAPVVVCEPGD